MDKWSTPFPWSDGWSGRLVWRIVVVTSLATTLPPPHVVFPTAVAQHAPYPPPGDALFYPLPPKGRAACLDGSSYGYYYRPPRSLTRKWTLYLQGGAWCWNETQCLFRSHTELGSSTVFHAHHANVTCTCVPPHRDCHCAFLPYCDGASFSGNRIEPWVLEENKLWFRGWYNWRETVQDLIRQRHLRHATEIVWTGGSAGGLATLLQLDAFAQLMRDEWDQKRQEEQLAHQAAAFPLSKQQQQQQQDEKKKNLPMIVGVMQDGFFLDHGTAHHHKKKKKDELPYPEQVRSSFWMQNVTVSLDCLAAFSPDNAHYCMMAPHAISYVQTPLFVLNSKFDFWQIQNILRVSVNSTDTVDYGAAFEAQAQTIRSTSHWRGAFVTSCICHGCSWEHLPHRHKTGWDYLVEWWKDVKTGNASSSHFTMDPSTIPNANNTLPNHYCQPFQLPPSSSSMLLPE